MRRKIFSMFIIAAALLHVMTILKNSLSALAIVTVLVSFLGVSCSTEKEPDFPNIVLINADDLGYGDLSCYGATLVHTPNIDRLASEGVSFTDAHAAAAVCSPSRYGLITGRYPLRRNLWGALIGLEDGLSIDTTQITIASMLKEAGYSTACIGKWHLGIGMDKPDYNKPIKPGPLEVGFDYAWYIPMVNSGPPFVYAENHSVVGYDPEDPFVSGKESVTQKWPGKIAANRKSGHLISQIDLLATFAGIVDKPLSKEECPDGINQLAELKGETKEPLRKLLMISPNSPSHLLVRKGDWVYIPARDEGGFQGTEIGDHYLGGAAATKLTEQLNSDIVNGEIKPDAPPAQLYNLKEDPYQAINVYGKYPGIQKELEDILISYRAEIGPYPESGWIHKKVLEQRKENNENEKN